MDKAQRKHLLDQYKQTGPDAGVYQIRNTRTRKTLLGSSVNLGSVRGKLDFARAMKSPSALDHRLHPDIREFGLEAFTFEVLELLPITPEMTPAQIRDDLTALEDLWRERLDQSQLY